MFVFMEDAVEPVVSVDGEVAGPGDDPAAAGVV
jgi:hypothetical protein